jgi:hypothetical protein
MILGGSVPVEPVGAVVWVVGSVPGACPVQAAMPNNSTVAKIIAINRFICVFLALASSVLSIIKEFFPFASP